MSFCDFVPDDPSCAPEPTPVEPTPVEPVDPVDPVVPVEPVDPEPVDPVEPVEPKPEAGGDGEVAEGDDKMASEAMWGNLAFLGVAVMHVVHPALEMFRYRSDADYYVLGDTAWDGTNWWSLYNMIAQYGLLAAGSVLTITQLLSMFGVAVETNVMLWHMATMWISPILFGAVGMMAWWAYDQAYVNCEDSGYANQADACSIMETIEYEMLVHSVMEMSWGATLMEASEGWMMAQFMALPMEAQKAWMEAHMAEEMMKKEHMEAKAKELGIDMKGSESEWSESDGDDM